MTFFVYGIGATLIIVGAVMAILHSGEGVNFGRLIIYAVMALMLAFQGWTLEKMFKQVRELSKLLKDKEGSHK